MTEIGVETDLPACSDHCCYVLSVVAWLQLVLGIVFYASQCLI